MKILLSIPGDLRTVPMNRFVAATLAEMGHEVILFDHGSRGIWPRLLKKADRRLFIRHNDREALKTAARERPDLFLAIFGFFHGRALLEELRRLGIPTACWWLNDPFQFARSAALAPYYDFYFTNASGCVEAYRGLGVKRAFCLPVGIFPAVHRPLEHVEKTYGVAFAGDWKEVREEILSDLAAEFPVALFGPWEKKLGPDSPLRRCLRVGRFFTPEEMVEIFCRSRVVLNIHTWFGRNESGVNPRLFEACGCGALQLCDRKDEIGSYYDEDREIVLYKTTAELREKLRYFLGRPGEAAEIGRRAAERTRREHTYRHRLERMLSLCDLY